MFDGLFGPSHLVASVCVVAVPLAFVYLAVKLVRKAWK